jgi:hypothetical protein
MRVLNVGVGVSICIAQNNQRILDIIIWIRISICRESVSLARKSRGQVRAFLDTNAASVLEDP